MFKNKECNYCGKEILANEFKCPHCFELVKESGDSFSKDNRSAVIPPPPPPSPSPSNSISPPPPPPPSTSKAKHQSADSLPPKSSSNHLSAGKSTGGSKSLSIIAAALLLVIGGAVFYFFFIDSEDPPAGGSDQVAVVNDLESDQPETGGENQDDHQDGSRDYDHNGIDDDGWKSFSSSKLSFKYPESLAEDLVIHTVLASAEGNWSTYPEYQAFQFDNYILEDTFHRPILSIIPVDQQIETGDYIQQTVNLLYDINRGIYGSSRDMILQKDITELPFLPEQNAGQVFYSNFKGFKFHWGRGIRYLTMYAQDIGPVTNHRLIYTFQGVQGTSFEQRIYVSLVLPVMHHKLPEDWDDYFANNDADTFYEGFDMYLNNKVELLETSTDNDFTPELDLLDQLVTTIEVY